MTEFNVVIDGSIEGVTKEGIEKGIKKLFGFGNPLEIFNKVSWSVNEKPRYIAVHDLSGNVTIAKIVTEFDDIMTENEIERSLDADSEDDGNHVTLVGEFDYVPNREELRGEMNLEDNDEEDE